MILDLQLDYLCNHLKLKDLSDPTPYTEVKRPEIIKSLCDFLEYIGGDNYNTKLWVREDQYNILDRYEWRLLINYGGLYARLDEDPSEIMLIKLAWSH